MNIKSFFIAASAFASLFLVQGAALIIPQKLVRTTSSAIPSRDFLFSEKVSSSWGRIIREKFSYTDNNKWTKAPKSVSVSFPSRRRAGSGLWGGRQKQRPKFSRGPMSF
ncbi:hypothetical protein [Bartonella sp. CB74]|uniref:hypothetical protein n=1 Tax=Bartonella sp. CB74 TaxID=3113620 RepID=UPI002F96B063